MRVRHIFVMPNCVSHIITLKHSSESPRDTDKEKDESEPDNNSVQLDTQNPRPQLILKAFCLLALWQTVTSQQLRVWTSLWPVPFFGLTLNEPKIWKETWRWWAKALRRHGQTLHWMLVLRFSRLYGFPFFSRPLFLSTLVCLLFWGLHLHWLRLGHKIFKDLWMHSHIYESVNI